MSIVSNLIPPEFKVGAFLLKAVIVILVLVGCYYAGYTHGAASRQPEIDALNKTITATTTKSDDQKKTTVIAVAQGASAAIVADVRTSGTISDALTNYRNKIAAKLAIKKAQASAVASAASSASVARAPASQPTPDDRLTLRITAHIPVIGDPPVLSPDASDADRGLNPLPPDPVVTPPFLSDEAVDAINTMVDAANS